MVTEGRCFVGRCDGCGEMANVAWRPDYGQDLCRYCQMEYEREGSALADEQTTRGRRSHHGLPDDETP